MKPLKFNDDFLKVLRSDAPIAIAVLAYIVGARVFIGDSSTNPILNIVIGVPLFVVGVVLLVYAPPFVCYMMFRSSRFVTSHRAARPALLVASCITPLTAVCVYLLPQTSRMIVTKSQTFAGVWLLITFLSASFLVFLLVHALFEPENAERAIRVEADDPGRVPTARVRPTLATLGSTSLSFRELITVLAGIATILGLLYTVGRDLYVVVAR